jgi:conjugative transposon TraN protein
MQRFKSILGQSLTFISVLFWNIQNSEAQQKSRVIAYPTPIEVTWDKTTVLFLDGSILSVDRGNRYLLAQKDQAANNLLKLKGGQRYFPNTNLHVVTDLGLVYKFEVRYTDAPQKTTYDLMQGEELVLDFPHNQADFLNNVNQIIGKKIRSMKRKQKYRMDFHLLGIYQQDAVLYFQLGVSNKSEMPYEIKELKAKIKDKKQAKRTSIREEDVASRYEYFQGGKSLQAKDHKIIILAYPQFTIADKKQLHLLIDEDHGDRNLYLKIKGKQLLKSRRLTTINQ